MFKALGDPTRIEIIKMLKGKEVCVGDITKALALSQPTISRQLRILKTAGLVKDIKDGRLVYYTTSDKALVFLKDLIKAQITKKGPKVHCPPNSVKAPKGK